MAQKRKKFPIEFGFSIGAIFGLLSLALVISMVTFIGKTIYMGIIEFQGIVNSSIIPNQTSTYTIGNETNTFSEGHFDRLFLHGGYLEEYGTGYKVDPLGTSVLYDLVVRRLDTGTEGIKIIGGYGTTIRGSIIFYDEDEGYSGEIIHGTSTTGQAGSSRYLMIRWKYPTGTIYNVMKIQPYVVYFYKGISALAGINLLGSSIIAIKGANFNCYTSTTGLGYRTMWCNSTDGRIYFIDANGINKRILLEGDQYIWKNNITAYNTTIFNISQIIPNGNKILGDPTQPWTDLYVNNIYKVKKIQIDGYNNYPILTYNNWLLRIQNGVGYLDLGPLNSYYVGIYTDTSRIQQGFLFNHNIILQSPREIRAGYSLLSHNFTSTDFDIVCDSGKVLSGGCKCEGYIIASYPINKTAWHCTCSATASTNHTAYIICMRVG